MPELPDVEIMRQYLQSTALHETVDDVTIRAPRVVPDADDAAAQLGSDLSGRSLEETRRHGKWLFVYLDGEGGTALGLHFGMTGSLDYFKDPADEPDYARVLFRLANGYHLAYVSPRKLGVVRVVHDVDGFIKRKDLCPDALDPGFDRAAFKGAVEGRRIMAKSVLMDQETLAGIGNVYSDEILFQARIHPRSQIKALEEEAVTGLYDSMRSVLQTAIDNRAEPDRFPDSYIVPHRHADGRCPICGEALKRVQVGSRHGYFCPNRQGDQGV
jgi:formamidopyrimidine-DNA glycosylase